MNLSTMYIYAVFNIHVKSSSLSLIICEQVRWFALKIVLIALFCNCSKKSEFFLGQDSHKIQQ